VLQVEQISKEEQQIVLAVQFELPETEHVKVGLHQSQFDIPRQASQFVTSEQQVEMA
jgi:hypothetical protein